MASESEYGIVPLDIKDRLDCTDCKYNAETALGLHCDKHPEIEEFEWNLYIEDYGLPDEDTVKLEELETEKVE